MRFDRLIVRILNAQVHTDALFQRRAFGGLEADHEDVDRFVLNAAAQQQCKNDRDGMRNMGKALRWSKRRG